MLSYESQNDNQIIFNRNALIGHQGSIPNNLHNMPDWNMNGIQSIQRNTSKMVTSRKTDLVSIEEQSQMNINERLNLLGYGSGSGLNVLNRNINHNSDNPILYSSTIKELNGKATIKFKDSDHENNPALTKNDPLSRKTISIQPEGTGNLLKTHGHFYDDKKDNQAKFNKSMINDLKQISLSSQKSVSINKKTDFKLPDSFIQIDYDTITTLKNIQSSSTTIKTFEYLDNKEQIFRSNQMSTNRNSALNDLKTGFSYNKDISNSSQTLKNNFDYRFIIELDDKLLFRNEIKCTKRFFNAERRFQTDDINVDKHNHAIIDRLQPVIKSNADFSKLNLTNSLQIDNSTKKQLNLWLKKQTRDNTGCLLNLSTPRFYNTSIDILNSVNNEKLNVSNPNCLHDSSLISSSMKGIEVIPLKKTDMKDEKNVISEIVKSYPVVSSNHTKIGQVNAESVQKQNYVSEQIESGIYVDGLIRNNSELQNLKTTTEFPSINRIEDSDKIKQQQFREAMNKIFEETPRVEKQEDEVFTTGKVNKREKVKTNIDIHLKPNFSQLNNLHSGEATKVNTVSEINMSNEMSASSVNATSEIINLSPLAYSIDSNRINKSDLKIDRSRFDTNRSMTNFSSVVPVITQKNKKSQNDIVNKHLLENDSNHNIVDVSNFNVDTINFSVPQKREIIEDRDDSVQCDMGSSCVIPIDRELHIERRIEDEDDIKMNVTPYMNKQGVGETRLKTSTGSIPTMN